MAKKRTRKQKEKAKHEFTIRWDPGSESIKAEPNVKGQFENDSHLASIEAKASKHSKISAKDIDLAGIKKNMFMSLLYAGFIITLEVVLYFIWK